MMQVLSLLVLDNTFELVMGAWLICWNNGMLFIYISSLLTYVSADELIS